MLKFSMGSLISMIYLILDVRMTSGYYRKKIDVIYVDVDVASCLINLSDVKTTLTCINFYCILRHFYMCVHVPYRICKLATQVKIRRKTKPTKALKKIQFYLAFHFLTC